MDIHISPADGVPIYLQIVHQVKYLVAAGRLAPGEEVPPIRVLAEQLLINPNTVARAYRELQVEGVLAPVRGTGLEVTPHAAKHCAAERVSLIRESVSTIKGVSSEMFVPEIHYRVPHVRIRWDASSTRLTVRDAIRLLRDGYPSIEVRPNTNDGLEMSVWLLEPSETEIVARRLRQVLRSA